MSKRKSKIFNLSSISIIACECLQGVVGIFVDLFLTANILKYSGEGASIWTNIFNIGLFYLISNLVLAFSYLVTGFYLKKHNKSVLVSVGAILFTVMVLIVYLLGDNLINWLPLVAVLYGVAYGLYSSGYHNLISETISSKHQVRFFAVKRTAVQAIYVIFPITIGYIVEYVNFSAMALIMVALCVIWVVFSFLIRPQKSYPLSFNIPKFVKYIKANKQSTEPLKHVYISNFFRGASCDAFSTLITILVWISFESNSTLGTMQSIFTVFSLAMMGIYLRYYRKKRVTKFIVPTIIMVLFTIVGILCTLGTNYIIIVIFYAVYTTMNVILLSISDSRRASTIRTLSLHSHMLESTALQEIFLGAGRTLQNILLVLTGLLGAYTNSIAFLLANLAIVSVLYILFGVSLMMLEKSLIRQDEQFNKVHINEQFEHVEE